MSPESWVSLILLLPPPVFITPSNQGREQRTPLLARVRSLRKARRVKRGDLWQNGGAEKSAHNLYPTTDWSDSWLRRDDSSLVRPGSSGDAVQLPGFMRTSKRGTRRRREGTTSPSTLSYP